LEHVSATHWARPHKFAVVALYLLRFCSRFPAYIGVAADALRRGRSLRRYIKIAIQFEIAREVSARRRAYLVDQWFVQEIWGALVEEDHNEKLLHLFHEILRRYS